MPKKEVPLAQLLQFLPQGSFEETVEYIQHYKVHLTITRQRQTILGDFRHKHSGKSHRISVNGNLNKFSFLITLLHELAHLFTFERYGMKAAPHGAEWKKEFGQILSRYVEKGIFPDDIKNALLKSISNPSASSCGDEKLLRVLRNYDLVKEGMVLAEQVPPGSLFKIKDDRVFKMGHKIRTRYKCLEVATGKWFLFSGVYEVRRFEHP